MSTHIYTYKYKHTYKSSNSCLKHLHSNVHYQKKTECLKFLREIKYGQMTLTLPSDYSCTKVR